jgi:Zn-dependent protease with chaperone function
VVKLAVRALGALALLVGAYLLVVGLVAGLAFGLRAVVGAGGGGYGAFRLLVFVLLLAAVAAWTLVTATLRGPDPVRGVRLARQEHPQVWALVDGVATAVRTRVPDELVLVDQASAAVLEHARFLRPSHRVLVLGAPLLVTLSAAQLTAVVAHELGHYSGRHTALARLTYRGQEVLVRMIRRLGPRSLLGRVLAQCVRAYVAVAAAVSRRYEFEADTYAAELVGAQVAAEAVGEVPLVAAGWHHYRRADVLAAEEMGKRPDRMLLVFGDLWSRGARRTRAVTDLGRWPEGPSIYDTHPPTKERVARLQASADSSPPPAEGPQGPALDLIADPASTFGTLEDQIYAGRELEAASWETLVAEEGRGRARGAAQQLGWAAEQEGLVDRGDLAALLEVVEDGLGGRLSGRYLDRTAPELTRQVVLIDLLTRTVENALLEQQGFRHVPGSEGEPVLVDAHGALAGVRDLVAPAVRDPAAVEPLRRWAGERGLLRVHHTLTETPAGMPDAPP